MCAQRGWGVRASVAGSTAMGRGLGLGCFSGGAVVWEARMGLTSRAMAAASEVAADRLL